MEKQWEEIMGAGNHCQNRPGENTQEVMVDDGFKGMG